MRRLKTVYWDDVEKTFLFDASDELEGSTQAFREDASGTTAGSEPLKVEGGFVFYLFFSLVGELR